MSRIAIPAGLLALSVLVLVLGLREQGGWRWIDVSLAGLVGVSAVVLIVRALRGKSRTSIRQRDRQP